MTAASAVVGIRALHVHARSSTGGLGRGANTGPSTAGESVAASGLVLPCAAGTAFLRNIRIRGAALELVRRAYPRAATRGRRAEIGAGLRGRHCAGTSAARPLGLEHQTGASGSAACRGRVGTGRAGSVARTRTGGIRGRAGRVALVRSGTGAQGCAGAWIRGKITRLAAAGAGAVAAVAIGASASAGTSTGYRTASLAGFALAGASRVAGSRAVTAGVVLASGGNASMAGRTALAWTGAVGVFAAGTGTGSGCVR